MPSRAPGTRADPPNAKVPHAPFREIVFRCDFFGAFGMPIVEASGAAAVSASQPIDTVFVLGAQVAPVAQG